MSGQLCKHFLANLAPILAQVAALNRLLEYGIACPDHFSDISRRSGRCRHQDYLQDNETPFAGQTRQDLIVQAPFLTACGLMADYEDWVEFEEDDGYCPFSPMDLDGESLGAVPEHGQPASNNDHMALQPCPSQQAVSMLSGVTDNLSRPPAAQPSLAHSERDDMHRPFSPVDLPGESMGAVPDRGQHAPNNHVALQPCPSQQAMSTPSGVTDKLSRPPLSPDSQVARQSSHEDVDMLASARPLLPCNPSPMAVDAKADLGMRRLRGKQHPLHLERLFEKPASDVPDVAEATVLNSIVATHRPYRQVQRKLAEYFSTNKHHQKTTKKKLWSKVRNHNHRISIMKSFLRSRALKDLDAETQGAAHEYVTLAINNPRVGRVGGDRTKRPPAKQASIAKAAEPAATAQSEDEDDAKEEQSQEMVGMAFQFTFYCRDDVFPEKYSNVHFPGLHDASEALLQNERPRLQKQQDRILAFVQSDIVPTLGKDCLEWGMQSEICPETWSAGVVRVHTHVQIHHKFMQVFRVNGKYTFESKGVFVRKTRVDRRNGKSTLNQAQYYVTLPKHGALLVGGNYLPHQDYRVLPQWIEGYQARGYLSDDAAIQEFLRAGANCKNYVGHARFRREFFREQKEELERQAVEREIQASLKPFKWIFTWHNFMNQFFPSPGEVFKRAACYVLDGKSCAGKSQFIRCQFPVGSLLSIDCSGGKIYPNYRKMVRSEIKAIVHEEGTPKMVLQHKAAFQSTNAQIELGNSPVNEGVYYRWFYRIPMIITCNDWRSLVLQEGPEDIEWLDRNCIVQTCDANTLY